jgi:hypothetical protein
VRNKKRKRESEKQTPDENLNLLEIFSLPEIEKIYQLVLDLRKLRKIDKTVENFKEEMERVLEYEFFYIGDFLIEQNWHKNKSKVEALWAYLRKQLS